MENGSGQLPLIFNVIKENILTYGNPLGLRPESLADWNHKIKLPNKGKTLIYSGGEHQLIPYLNHLTKVITRLETEGKTFSLMVGAGKFLNRLGLSLDKVYGSLLNGEQKRFEDVPFKAAAILKNMGTDLCFLGEEELYSGALLFEMGYIEELKGYAGKVATQIESTGASEVVCLSPHTVELFRDAYKNLLGGFNIDVYSFSEYLVKHLDPSQLITSGKQTILTIHDPCRLTRDSNIAEETRQFFTTFPGVDLREPVNCKEWTSCCGGPIKMVFPELAHMISRRRLSDLTATGAELVLTFCPYCLASFVKNNKEERPVKIVDFIEFIYGRMTNAQ